MKKRILSMLLTIVMVIGMFPTAAFAAEADNLCEHHAEHTAECGYVEGVSDCAYHCDVCLGHDHGDEVTEKDTESAPVCDCGTDDPAIHATTCAVYVAPENPVCYCAEKCTEVNEWCDVCGFDYTACTGTDTAVAYAEGDKVSVTVGGETTYYTSIIDAVAKANESGNATITLLQDTTTGERLDITNSATLDLNGNTLSCTAYFADDYETMVAITTNNTKLTIIDSVGGGKLDGTGTDYALMLGEPGAYTARSASAYIDGSTVSGSVKTVSGTSMTVSGSTVESNSVVATIDMTNETTLNVFNSQILNTHSSSTAPAIDNSGTLTITDSTVSGSIGVDNRGTANISGNTNITGTVCSVKSRVESQDSTLTITGGNYTGGINITGGTATISGGSYTGDIVVSGGTATISGGTITASSAENAVEVFDSAELTISGGTFSAIAGKTYDTGVYVHDGGTVKITGGTITSTAYGVYNDGGSATITGGSISGGTVDLYVGGSDSILKLTLDEGKTVGATFPGGITVEGTTLAELLAADTAAYWGVVDGKDTMLTVADDAATGITDKGDITIRAICDHKDVKLDYITTETTHTPVCSVCNWTGEATEHTGGTATCQDPAVCEACGVSYGNLDANIHTHTEGTIFTVNENGTHSYTCACGAAVAEVPHTLDVTTGKCVCGADMTAIATVTDGTNTYYAADAATLNQAVTAILEKGSRTFTVELPADAEAGMITAIRRAICDTEGVADGSINLTLKGVTSIPGTTNWDGVAFGPGDIYDEAGKIVDQELVTQLASINLPDVTEIGAQAFYFCENLVSVSAPKAQTIGAQAFGYTALTSVEFPELTTIPTDMFSGTWTLSSAKFPKVTTIEQGGLLVGGKFTPENNPTPFPLELTAEGDITFNGSYHFNIAERNYTGKVDLVLWCDKKDAVTFQEDGTATWQVREDLSYTFKSITFKHSYVDGKCTACGEDCAHTGGTATCTTPAVCDTCGVSYGEVDTTNHDSSVECENGFCPNGCYEPATLNAAGYYEIDNAGKLFWFAQQVNVKGNREIKGVLTANIDLENKPWTPIGETGEENNNFRGVFDGQNYTIRGLNVEGSENGVGFFGEVRTGTVKNFTIYGNVVVNTEVAYVGGVIGSICGLNSTDHGLERNGAIIQNITSFVNVTAKAHGIGMIGGFVGYANHQSLIEQCAWYGTFDAGEYRVDSGAGGFIGKIQENTSEVTIRNCGAYGTIKTNYAGDYNNTATIYMGGFLSFSNTNAQTTLENCLFAGRFERGENLTDQAFLGAFGTLRSVNAIKNCYYLGDDGLEAVHSDSNLKPGSDNVEITSVTGEELRSNTIATQLGDHWMQDVHYPIPKDTKAHSDSATYTYTDNGDGTHKKTCNECGYVEEVNEEHYVDPTTTYTDNGDGTHSFKCAKCDAVVDSEPHTIENHVCTACGAKEIVVSFNAGDYKWETGDQINFAREVEGICIDYCVFTATVAEDGTVTWSADKPFCWYGEGEQKLFAAPNNGWSIDYFVVPEDQSTVAKLDKADLINGMWVGTPTTDTITFNMTHRMAKVTVNYEFAEGVTADISELKVYSIAQICRFSLDDWSIITSAGQYDVLVTPYLDGNQFTAFVSPDAYAADGNFIKITLSDGSVREVKMNKAVTFAEGAEYTYKVVITADGAYLTCADECSFEYTANEDGLTHSKTCSKCGYVAASEAHSGGTATCIEQAECQHCGTSYGEVDKTNHDTENAEYDNGFCTGCDAFEPATDSDSNNYYEIDNAGKLYWFATQVNSGNTNINGELKANIVINNDVLAEMIRINPDPSRFRLWTPIGTEDNAYIGDFCGLEHTVSGLYFNDSNAGYVGLFGYVGSGAVNHVGVIDSYFNGSGSVGGVVGHNEGTVEYAYSNSYVGGNVCIGGVVGDNRGTVMYAYNLGSISGLLEVGGVVGANYNTVKNCYNIVSISGDSLFGDVVGDNSGTLENCYYPADAETDELDGTTAKTWAQFKSGEVAYLLGRPFGQTIGTNSLPVLYGETVYYGYTSCGDTAAKYTNDETISAEKPDHTQKPTYTDNGDGTHSASYSCCGTTVTEDHTLNYTANGNIITESCSIGCGHTGTATISATGKTYDGNAVEVTVSKTGSLENTIIPVTLTKDGEAFTGEPVNAGAYTASVTLGGKTVSVDFTIAKAAAGITFAPTPDTLTYIGEAQYLINPGEAVGGTMVYSLSENGEYTTSIPQGTNAGDYTVWYYVQGDANYNDSAKDSVAVTIEKATVTVTAGAKSKTYGTDNPALTYTASGLLGNDTLTGALATTATKTSNVGEYDITVGSLAGSNYTIHFVGAKLTITKAAAPDIAWPTAAELTYGQTLSDSALTSEDKNGTFAWQDGSIVPTVTNNGYVIVYTPKDTDNYDYSSVKLTETISVTVSKVSATVTAAPTPNTLTYTGEGQYLINAGEANGGTMQYSTDNQTWSTTIPQGTDAGKYTVYYKVVGDENHSDTAVDSIEVTIAKADPVIGTVGCEMALFDTTAASAVELTWTNTTVEGDLVLTDSELTVGEGTYNWKFTPEDTDNYNTITGTVVLTVTADVLEQIRATGTLEKFSYVYGEPFSIDGMTVTASYTSGTTKDVTGLVSFDRTLAVGQTAVELTYQGKTCTVTGITVVRKQLVISGMSWTVPTNAVYSGTAYTATLNGTLPEGVSVTKTGDTATNAGSYTAKAVFSLAEGYSADNYEIVNGEDLTEAWSIAKKDIAGADVVLGDTLTYTGSEQTQTVTKVEVDGLTVTYTVSGNTGTDVGKYTLTATGTGNYTGSVTKEWSIGKAAAVIATAPAENDLIYTGTAQNLVNAGSANGGTMVYSLSENGQYTETIPTGTNAGEYTVYYKVVGDTNHSDTAVGSVGVTIAKADPSYTVPTGLTATYGELLSSVVLPAGFAWTDGGQTVGNVGNNTFTATYTPSDTVNYKVVESISVSVVVGKAASGCEAPEAVSGLSFNGGNQNLITAGTATGGTMQYSLDGSNWSETIPTGKDAKTYTVYYKVVGDSNHNDSSVDSVQVTIGKATLIVKADNKTMTTGQNLPTFTYTITGFVHGETEDVLTAKPTVVCVADGKTAGTYDITVSDAAADNYEISYVNGTLSVADHQHAWTYTANGATITATCANTDGHCPDAEQSITISAVGKTYDGTPVTATLTGSIDGVATPEITYTGNTNAGTHTASITIEGKTASVKFTIEKATVTVTADAKSKPYGTDNPTLTYTSEGLLGDDVLTGALETKATKTSNVGEYDITVGSLANSNYTIDFVGAKLTITKAAAPEIQWPTAAALTYGQKLSDSALTSQDENGTFAWQDGSIVPTVKNNGYVVVYTPKDTDNYDYTVVELTETIPVTVSKVSATVTVAPTPNTLTYTGEAQYLISAGEANGGTMLYSSTEEDEYTTSIPQGTNAGDYTVWCYVQGDANHNDSAKASVDVTIEKAEPKAENFVFQSPTNQSYNGESQTASVSVKTGIVGMGEITAVMYYVANPAREQQPISAGDYFVQINVGEGENYTAKSFFGGEDWVFTIAPKMIYIAEANLANVVRNDSNSYDLTVTSISFLNVVNGDTLTLGEDYTATAEQLEITSSNLTGYQVKAKVTVTLLNSNYTLGDGVTYNTYANIVEHEHDWKYTANGATITATCNAEGCPDAEQSITISAVGKTYDGTPVTATLTGSIDGVATPEITYTGNTNAGTHTASITIEGKTASVKFTIEKATVTVTADAKTKPYGTDNPALTYTSEGLLGDDALTGALETTATKTSNVGEYDITVGSLANSNYTIDFVGAKLTITKAAAPDIAWPTASSLVYGQPLSASTLTSQDENGTFAWQDGSIVPTVKNNGYVVVYTPKDTDNYDYTVVELTETIPVTVSKVSATVTVAPTPNTLTYTGTAQNLVNAGSANGGTMVYSLSENGQYTETIPTGTNAGEYTVWYYVDGDDNHSDSAKASVEVTIAKAKAVINVDTTPINVVYGEEVTMPTATTNFGQVSCDKTATDLVNAGTYTVTYSVAGTDNYEGAEKTLTVTVGQKSVAEPTVTGTYTYTGAEQTVVLTGVESYMTVASGNKGTNAGNYEVEITLNSNYKWADDSDGKVQWSIAKAQAEIRVNTDPITVTYGETVKLPTATTNFGNVVCSKTADGLVNAGTYTVTYSVAGTDNYAGDTKTLTVTVGQKTVTEPAITGTYTYTGAEQTVVLAGVESCMTIVSGNKGTDVDNYEVEVTLDGNHKWAEGSDGKVQWSIIKAQAEISVNTDPITVIYGEEVTLPAATTNFGTVSCDKTTADLVNVGSYTVTYTVAGTANYAGDTETVTVTINPKAITADDVELKGTLTYNGSEQIQQITGKNGITCDVTGNKANDVGTYELTVTGTGNYTGEVKLSYTVAKKPISVVWENTNLVHNGSAQSPVAKLAGVVTDDDVQAVVNGNGTNAGTYDATVSLTGTDADNYALTGSTKFTIARAPVTFKVSNNSVEEGKAIAVTVISEPAGVGHTVTYRQNGDLVTPSAVGEYDIYVEITDSNYRHAASANGNAIKIGVLTIYEGKKPATYTLSYAPGEGSGTMAAEEAALAGTIRILPECTFTAPKDSNNNDMLFVGWTDGNATYKAGEQYRQPEKNVTMTALWVVEEHNISGMVKQFVSLDSTDLVNRGGVVVTLMLGSKQVAQAVTDANGNYKFEHCLLGTYNLVAEYEGIRQTAKAVLGHSDMSDLGIDLPAGKTNSTVDVEPGTPDVVVGGLDEMMKTTDDKVFTEEDKEVVEQGGEVEIKMEVKENPAPEKKDDLEKKAEEISTVTEIGIFIDLDLTKTVTEAAETTGTTTTIAEASKLLENIIFLPGHLQGKNAYYVFREHGGKIEEMTELHAVPTGDNEGFIVDRVNHTITIYSMKYSTYAIAYTDSFTITFNANGGKVDVESAITGTDGTLESLPTPTRSGYTFKGWFTAESGGTEVTTDTVFNADKIIYAQWTMNYVPTPSGGSTNKITVSTALNGKVSADLSNAKEGTTVTITVEPDDGYELDELLVSDASGNELKVTANGNNKYSFVMPDSKVSIKATFVPEREECTGGDSCLSAQFSDLDPSLWYHEATDYVLENGLMNGVGGGKFDPNGTTSRAMIVTILWRLEGEPVVNYLMQFGDVAAESWYTEAVRWAASEKIVEGWNGKFDPMGEITREQFATILWRYAKYKGYDVSVGEDTNILSYEDAFSISEYAIPAMQWACGAGLMQGDGVNLTPKADATRAQAAALFQRFCENVAEK